MKAKTERFELRLDDDLLDRVDDWHTKQGGALSRAEAVRQLTSIGLAIGDDRSMRISDAERLIISVLCDTLRAPKSRELDTEFIAACIDGGHHWALK